MPDLITDLNEIRDRAAAVHAQCETAENKASLDEVMEAVGQAEIAHSGSWIGYQSCVYYKDLKRPPGGAFFDKQFGLNGFHSGETRGEWVQYNYPDIFDCLRDSASNPTLEEVGQVARHHSFELDDIREELVGIIDACIGAGDDAYLERLKKEASTARMLSPDTFAQGEQPRGTFISHDYTAMGSGPQCPPHVAVRSHVKSIQSLFYCALMLSKIADRTRKYLERRARAATMLRRNNNGTKIFIGHGRSPAWRELKDYIQDNLGLECDEFNRQETAGMSTQARLVKMLDDASFAFLVMTAEDEQKDGSVTARLNVVHEVGLFQGRLGFEKAIVLLEKGCEQFSNIHGLTHLPFDKGKIEGVFHRVLEVLKREGIIEA